MKLWRVMLDQFLILGRVLLELLRILAIFAILGSLASAVLGKIYAVFEAEDYFWFGTIGIITAIFVLYRNKLQFSGWYKGKGMKKLPKAAARVLVIGSIALIILPLLLVALEQ